MGIFSYKKYMDDNIQIIPPSDFSCYMTDEIVTVNGEMRKTLDLARRVAQSDAPIIITGPSGVGKEMLASMIHHNSKRHSKPFIKLNCASIPENLIESEFFGYEPGAFTGALRGGKHGVVQLAEGGTLFLDEIGEMTLNLQAKLLRVLQDGKYLKVGGLKEIQSNIRIISATNKDFDEMINSNTFREDLYFRLNVISLYLPPLNERADDIPLLALYFLKYYNSQYNVDKKISPNVIEELIHYPWPGNVRELKNTIERLVLVSMDTVISLKDLEYSSSPSKMIDPNQFFPNHSIKLKDQSLESMMYEFEKNIINQTVKKMGSIRKAAKVLKVSPSTISRKLSSYQDTHYNNPMKPK